MSMFKSYENTLSGECQIRDKMTNQHAIIEAIGHGTRPFQNNNPEKNKRWNLYFNRGSASLSVIGQKVYEVTKEEIQVPEEVFAQIPNRPTWKEYIYIRLSFDKFDITTYSYTPKFELIETFCYLGGYVGIWLGISLVAVFDFAESILVIMRHPYKRMKSKLHSKIKPSNTEERQFQHHYY
ncbi:hypothetical protein CEXT_29861 [Caerostris extrusa]|uniref:Uncharacterized protein n=1 Tax=Caerostris extrusa TaxID=172846 RepID=A0AAV4PGW5_CAEEX|nr:hypothetical protein CEXT_29861 [Caerostris extrusa]